ncbi:hypothetical protein LO762_09635 [Actinocorallia sp. API 0066]|uniref:hypothetical protein n=1 Tax=Actinocorallia sp. API 0066 TaxID=2896846 RepID=UPI001E2A78FB|nr:hypothetical protein [Actinocorallia sp. API 0066]MCD0449449.1 hypothetical protein [Actinocorallia sp. API 0066]
MTQEDDAHQRLMEFMLGGQKPKPKQDGGAKTKARKPRSARFAARTKAEISDDELRALGINRPERERLRRGRQRSGTPNKDREKAKALLRIGFYIDEQVEWETTDLDREEVVAAWAFLSNHDVDRVNQWWAEGVHPLDITYIRLLQDNGFEPTDLYRTIHGKTVLQHLREGTSPQWCLLALSWDNRT